MEHHRCGFIVRIKTDDGLTGHGEAAALPAFGTGTTDTTERHLKRLTRDLEGRTLEEAWTMIDATASDPTAAPGCFALDTALLDIAAQESGVPISRLLRPDASGVVPVNATVTEMDPARAATEATSAAAAGFTALKLKVGVLRDPVEEVERVAAVREAIGPCAELRLDANGSWSDQQATEMAHRLKPFDISYLEQPLPAQDLAGMAGLRKSIDIRIAADESATTAQSVREIVRLQAADVLIIKPGVVGGLRRSRDLIEVAAGAGLVVVVTTALETGIGIAASLHLAATLPPPIPACGLATGALLEDDFLVEPPRISRGAMDVPAGPGLGIELAREKLEFRTD